jgi:integrase
MNIILRYAYKQRQATHLVSLPNPDAKANAGRVFTAEEISKLWEAMNDDTRDQFVLCLECFMRLREALYLTWDRVDLISGVVTLRPEDVKTGTKTGKGRSFRLSDHAFERLKARRKRIDSPFVFPSPTDPAKPMHQNKTAWILAKETAGIKGRARWHDLRHSALTIALLDAKMDPILVSEYAGVSLRTIQAVYLHSTHDKTASVAGAVKIKT